MASSAYGLPASSADVSANASCARRRARALTHAAPRRRAAAHWQLSDAIGQGARLESVRRRPAGTLLASAPVRGGPPGRRPVEVGSGVGIAHLEGALVEVGSGVGKAHLEGALVQQPLGAADGHVQVAAQAAAWPRRRAGRLAARHVLRAAARVCTTAQRAAEAEAGHAAGGRPGQARGLQIALRVCGGADRLAWGPAAGRHVLPRLRCARVQAGTRKVQAHRVGRLRTRLRPTSAPAGAAGAAAALAARARACRHGARAHAVAVLRRGGEPCVTAARA